MPRIAGSLAIAILTLLTFSAGGLRAAENRMPTPEEFKQQLRQYNESGTFIAPQPTRHIPKSVEQFNRAVTLHTGKNPSSRDLKEAAALYQAASEAGMPQAETNLALLYLEGKGVKKDVRKALVLLNAASAKNNSQADIALARLYLIGKDVPKDEKKAESLLNKAAKAGNQNAVKMLAEYKEWKKKNDLAMKQYQDLMKQVQSARNKSAGLPVSPVPQPFIGLPYPQKPPVLQFPVIPGYSFLAANRFVAPSVNQAQSETPVFKVVPEGAASFQPLKVETTGQSGN